MLSVVTSPIMLSVVMLNVVMLSVVAPTKGPSFEYSQTFLGALEYIVSRNTPAYYSKL
jgi:hypothetical protein